MAKQSHGYFTMPGQHPNPVCHPWDCLRRIDGESVGIILVLDSRRTRKNIRGRKMNDRELARRSLERRFFCPFNFLPSLWLWPKAALIQIAMATLSCNSDQPALVALRRAGFSETRIHSCRMQIRPVSL